MGRTVDIHPEHCQTWLSGSGTLTLTRSVTGKGLLKAIFTPNGVKQTSTVCVETVDVIRRRIEDRLRKDETAVLETAVLLGVLPKQQID